MTEELCSVGNEKATSVSDVSRLSANGKVAYVYILATGALMFLLSSVKNYSYIITQGMDWNARKEIVDYLATDLPSYLADKGLVFAITFLFVSLGMWRLLRCVFEKGTPFSGSLILVATAWMVAAGVVCREWLYIPVGYCLSTGIAIALECKTRKQLKCSDSFCFFVFLLLLINMYGFFSLVGVGGGLESLAPLVVSVCALSCTRYFFLKCLGDQSLGAFIKMITISGLCSSLVFVLSFHDFDSGAAYGGFWRQLYYLVVFSILFQAYLMPFLANSSCGEDDCTDAVRQRAIWLAAGLSITLPGLCAFSVHGVLVLIAVPLLAVTMCLYTIYGSFDQRRTTWKGLLPLALFLSGTVIVMVLDPMIAPSPEEGLLPLVPAASSAVGAVAISCTSRLFKEDNEKELKIIDEIIDAITGKSRRTCEVKAQLSIIASSAAWILAFILYYALYKLTGSAGQAADGANAMEVVFQQPLVGIGGLYRFSWAVVPAVLSVFAINVCKAMSIRFGKSR